MAKINVFPTMEMKKTADLGNGELVRLYDAPSNDFVLALTTAGPTADSTGKPTKLALLLNDKPEVIVLAADARVTSFGLNYSLSVSSLVKLNRGFSNTDLLSLYLLCGMSGYRLRLLHGLAGASGHRDPLYYGIEAKTTVEPPPLADQAGSVTTIGEWSLFVSNDPSPVYTWPKKK